MTPRKSPPGKGKGVKNQVQTGVERLKRRLKTLQLEMVIIAGDGNCQFRSVAQQLYGCESHHDFVRAATVQYMCEHATHFGVFFEGGGEGAEFRRYLQKMRRGRTWGDELTLRGICNSLGCHIHVVTSTEKNWYLKYDPDTEHTNKQVFLCYISPAHYNGINVAASLNVRRGQGEGPAESASSSAKNRSMRD